MPNTFQKLKSQRNAILALAEHRGISNIRVFGSVVREEDTPQSDIDFLVDLAPGRDLLDWSGFWGDLENLLGHKVDVVIAEGIHWAIKNDVLSEAKPL